MKYLEQLNDEQKKAVLTTDGPMMILAGAGSGKTRTIIARIVHLIKGKNINPWEILAVTFSNRAANEMRERIIKTMPDISTNQLNLSTFHAFCAKMLRYNGELVGLKSSFSIYDDSESTAVAKAILKKHEIDPKKTPPSNLTHYIDQIKNTGFYLGRNVKLKKDLLENELYPLYQEYEAELKNNNAVDFGGLITKCLELLEHHPQVLDYYNNKYKYVLVDEYQDTNKAQFDLMCLLSKKHKNICVVGDSDQCVIKGTNIKTPNGDVLVEDLTGELLTYFGQIEPSPFSKKHENFYRGDVVKITLDSNDSITTTEKHVHFTLNKQSKPMGLDDCHIVYLGGNQNVHLLKFFNYTKESSSLEELYSFYKGVARTIPMELKEQIKIGDKLFNFTFAHEVKEGDLMILANGNTAKVTMVEKFYHEGLVYDMNVEGSHNYVANNIITHNSIYSWRGAEIRNILDFEKVFNDAIILKLEENYRSSKNIIQAASEMIKKNIFRKDKSMFTSNSDGEKIKIYQCQDGLTESLFVAQSINKLLKANVSPKEIAVFYRTNSQSRSLEDNLRRYLIPYQIIGGLKFYERKEVKDVIAYLQVMANPYDEISLLRVINTPARGLGDKAVSSLLDKAREAKLNVFDYLKMCLQTDPSKLGSSKNVASLRDFTNILLKGQEMVLKKENPVKIFDMILDKTGYLEQLQVSKKYEDQARVENLKELKSSIVQYVSSSEDKTLTAYLQNITLDRTEDNLDYGKVSLMTVHSSKGLEFDHVFLVGLEENLFPSAQSISDGRERLEEERRLFYVAITRARKNLHILYAIERMMYGKSSRNYPSRFLDELPKEYVTKYRF